MYDDENSFPAALNLVNSRDIYTISRLNREARSLLEQNFPILWIEGEISNLARPASGHLYFSLKDAAAQVRCAMFKQRGAASAAMLQNGAHVLARARVSMYEGRGEFQLIVEHIEDAGDGALRRRFEQLKQRLAAEGLFELGAKKALPTYPSQIGVITSPSGAAIRDILSVLKRRFPALPVLIYPVPVQGEGSAAKIAQAIGLAAQRQECDVLILARGGGSLEDLQAFNDELVARAIYACTIPLVTGIGHEVDFTIADFVADQRAPTPSAAAELVSPDAVDWCRRFGRQQERLTWCVRDYVQRRQLAVQSLAMRLERQHPGKQLEHQAQRLDELDQRIAHAWRNYLRHHQHTLNTLMSRLQRHNPAQRVQDYTNHLGHLSLRLHNVMQNLLQQKSFRFHSQARALDAVSPLATLGRGYAIVQRHDGSIVRAASQVAVGDSIEARLAQGHLICTVTDRFED